MDGAMLPEGIVRARHYRRSRHWSKLMERRAWARRVTVIWDGPVNRIDGAMFVNGVLTLPTSAEIDATTYQLARVYYNDYHGDGITVARWGEASPELVQAALDRLDALAKSDMHVVYHCTYRIGQDWK
jgi:hypothetical protein